jgi:hypothetical protein
METPEQQYARRQASAAGQRSRQAAGKHDDEANRWQMTVDVYGREGKDYSDPEKAAEGVRQRDWHRSQAARHTADAERHEAIARVPPPGKRRWRS